MKVLVLGIQWRSGISKGTGKQYGPFFTLHYASNGFEKVETQKFSSDGAGLAPREVDCKDHLWDQIKDTKFPFSAEVEIGVTNDRRAVVTGIKQNVMTGLTERKAA